MTTGVYTPIFETSQHSNGFNGAMTPKALELNLALSQHSNGFNGAMTAQNVTAQSLQSQHSNGFNGAMTQASLVTHKRDHSTAMALMEL